MVDFFDPCRRVNDCGPPSYGANDEYFTIRLWLKGCMQQWCYAGGECHFFDWCHVYKMTFQRLDNWCVRLGCVDVVRYYYRPMYATFTEGVKAMDDENAFHEMCVQGMKDKKIDVYVKHLRDESDIEAQEFGRSSLSRLKQVADLCWESFVEKIDGSFLIYHHRNNDEVEQQPPSCCKKLFGERDVVGADKSCEEDGGYNEDSDSEDFVDDDFRVEEEDEDYEEIVTNHGCATARISRRLKSPEFSSSSFNIVVPLGGEVAEESEYSDDSELHSMHLLKSWLSHLICLHIFQKTTRE